MSLVDPFDGVAVPRGAVAESLAVFARCEYAMKETGYKRDDHGIAAPEWQRLANDTAAWFEVPPGSHVALATAPITSDLPKLQSFVDGWQSSPLRGATQRAPTARRGQFLLERSCPRTWLSGIREKVQHHGKIQ